MERAGGPEAFPDPALLVAELAELADQAVSEYQLGTGESQENLAPLAEVAAEKARVLQAIAAQIDPRSGQGDYRSCPVKCVNGGSLREQAR
ncbi:MAG: hypothetical protein DIU55_000950, partial [Bacillota bacterium]